MKKQRFFLHAMALGLFVSSCGLLGLANSTPASARPLSTCSTSLLVAHRGYEPGRIIENTFPAFTRAIRTGARTIETDIQITKDGHWVLMHDFTINRTTRGKGYVSQLTLNQIKNVKTKDGVRRGVPSMREAFWYLHARSSLKMQVEIKPATTNTAILRDIVYYINYYKVHSQVTVISFHGETLRAIRAIDPTLNTGLLTTGAVSPATAKAYGNNVMMHQRGISPALVNSMHAAGIRVFTWTVNDRAIWSRVVSAGVDGVTTDQPPTLNRYCIAARR